MVKMFDFYLHRFKESGLIQKLIEKYLKTPEKSCPEESGHM